MTKVCFDKIDGGFTAEYLEQQKQIATEKATRQYLLASLGSILIKGAPFKEWLEPELTYFLMCQNKQTEQIALTTETLEVAEFLKQLFPNTFTPRVSSELIETHKTISAKTKWLPGNCINEQIINSYLALYQTKPTRELYLTYKRFNGHDFLTACINNKINIVSSTEDYPLNPYSRIKGYRQAWGYKIPNEDFIDVSSIDPNFRGTWGTAITADKDIDTPNDNAKTISGPDPAAKFPNKTFKVNI